MVSEQEISLKSEKNVDLIVGIPSIADAATKDIGIAIIHDTSSSESVAHDAEDESTE